MVFRSGLLFIGVFVVYYHAELNTEAGNKNDLLSQRLVDGSHLSFLLFGNGSYEISVNSTEGTWSLPSGDTYFYVDGVKYSLEEGNLILSAGPSEKKSGSDILGHFNYLTMEFTAGPVVIEAMIRQYPSSNTLIFTQRYQDGALGTSMGDKNAVASAFPSFRIQDGQTADIGFHSWGGGFSGQLQETSDRFQRGTTKINDGENGGPLVLFDRSGSALVISFASSFTASNLFHDHVRETVDFGVKGTVDSIPLGFTVDTIFHLCRRGINSAVMEWGHKLMTLHGKERTNAESDFTANYLGYYTDNGAYYYYNTEEGMNYEETVKAVVQHCKENQIPIRYFQLDSWWYFKDITKGMVNWTAMPEIFPNGLRELHEAIQMPILAHNRWFSPETTYASQNGGKYDFVIEKENYKAITADQRFWEDLLTDAPLWGLTTYEQDWLDRIYQDMDVTHTNISIVEDWLSHMNSAAARQNLNIQYCMALPRYTLHSLLASQVTQIRVSQDYLVNFWNWLIGRTSLLAHALGLVPFKDTFISQQTRAALNGCENFLYEPFKDECVRAVFPDMHLVISVLSAGPVAPGDRIGEFDRSLIMKSCNSDGLLLKPDKPATAIDSSFWYRAYGNGTGPNGEVWSTYVAYPELNNRYEILFVGQLRDPYVISRQELNLPEGEDLYYCVFPTEVCAKFSAEVNTLTLNTTDAVNFYVVYFPVYFDFNQQRVFILGELSKVVPLSRQRLVGLTRTAEALEISLTGAPGEDVEIHFYSDPLGSYVATCRIPARGRITLSYPTLQCR
ncbi:unnamed protein product [Cyprideis torosa]|uniref:Uncharacterized protein n=1 Tax=Cyprideis torosa TaxID=163714 RepID=A0A7R8WEB5_9CRUS|nr:unnamed protein product [Cyprideis torosa]CAG0889291.1 unnamed protein product [Cyprideis torosa]